MSDPSTDGTERIDEQQEQTFVERHGQVGDGITVGTILEYDGWQWALVSELAVDRGEPKLGIILLDEVGDHIVKQLETENGCRQHYEVIKHLRGSEHEYWTSVDYVLSDEIWSVLGPLHPDFRSDEDSQKELVTDGGQPVDGTQYECPSDSCEYVGPAGTRDYYGAHIYVCRRCGHEIPAADPDKPEGDQDE